LNYQEIDYDRSLLTTAMLEVELVLDDELSHSRANIPVSIRLKYA